MQKEQSNTKLTTKQALALNNDLFLPGFQNLHERAIVCFGLSRWLELATQAREEGKVPSRYFSTLVKNEWAIYNHEKKYHEMKQHQQE